jgi:oxaloacetate decarboxylase alpha subunit
MTGTLKAQLAQYDMQDRLVDVLEECVRVREELGHPVSATPFSQLIGIQSVLNIVTGERWSVVPDEVIIYLMGKFGEPPAPVDEDVRDKVLSSAHGQRFAGWERPQPSLAELREQYGGPRISDEELLLRYMVPREDLQAARAAGPVKPTYDLRDTTTLRELVDQALALRRPRHVRIERPEFQLALRRA